MGKVLVVVVWVICDISASVCLEQLKRLLVLLIFSVVQLVHENVKQISECACRAEHRGIEVSCALKSAIYAREILVDQAFSTGPCLVNEASF